MKVEKITFAKRELKKPHLFVSGNVFVFQAGLDVIFSIHSMKIPFFKNYKNESLYASIHN